MRFPQAVFASALFISASAASAETRVFILANHPDTYGIDQCLAKGEKCGAHAARAYCQSRDFAQASSFRRVEPDEITGFVPKGGAHCPHGRCDYVAITVSDNRKVPATSAPWKRRDDAAQSGYGRRPRPIGLADSLLAGHA